MPRSARTPLPSMREWEAAALIADAVPEGGVWADFGAGTGTFTGALAQRVGIGGRVLAIDADPRAVAALRQLGRERVPGWATIEAYLGDFSDLAAIDALRDLRLDGALFANALHFTSDPGRVLAAAALRVRDGGRLVIVEYDDRPANRWVPHPIGKRRLEEVAAAAGLGAPVHLAERPSRYGGIIYGAMIDCRHA